MSLQTETLANAPWITDFASRMTTPLTRPTLQADGTVQGAGLSAQGDMAMGLNALARTHPVKPEELAVLEANPEFIEIRKKIHEEAKVKVFGSALSPSAENKLAATVLEGKGKATSAGSLWNSFGQARDTGIPENSDEAPRRSPPTGVWGYIVSFLAPILNLIWPHAAENTMLATANEVGIQSTNKLIAQGLSGKDAILVGDYLTRAAIKEAGGDVTVTPIMAAAIAVQQQNGVRPAPSVSPSGPPTADLTPYRAPSEIVVQTPPAGAPDPGNLRVMLASLGAAGASAPYLDTGIAQALKMPAVDTKPNRPLSNRELYDLATTDNNPLYDRVRAIVRSRVSEKETAYYMRDLPNRFTQTSLDNGQTELPLPSVNGKEIGTLKLTSAELDGMAWTEKHNAKKRAELTSVPARDRVLSPEEKDWAIRYQGPKDSHNGRPSRDDLLAWANSQQAQVEGKTPITGHDTSGLVGAEIQARRERLPNVGVLDLAKQLEAYNAGKPDGEKLALPGLPEAVAKAGIEGGSATSAIRIKDAEQLMEKMHSSSLASTKESDDARHFLTVAEAMKLREQMGKGNEPSLFGAWDGPGKERPHATLPIFFGSVKTPEAQIALFDAAIKQAGEQNGWFNKNKLTTIPIPSEADIAEAKKAALASLNAVKEKYTKPPAADKPRIGADGKPIASLETQPQWLAEAQLPGVSGGSNIDTSSRGVPSQATPTIVADATERLAAPVQVG